MTLLHRIPALPLNAPRTAVLLALLASGLVLLAWTGLRKSARMDETAAQANPMVPAVQQPGSLREILARPDFVPTHHHALLGKQAPNFELADAAGKICKLVELRNGRQMVLIFYYGSHCIHCARHLAEMKRDLPLFDEVGAQVVAVSPDPPELTRQRPQKAGLTILSDPGNKVAEVYGVFKPTNDERIGNIRRHGTFIIDRDGIIRWANIGDAPFRRNSALLCELAKMEGCLPPCR